MYSANRADAAPAAVEGAGDGLEARLAEAEVDDAPPPEAASCDGPGAGAAAAGAKEEEEEAFAPPLALGTDTSADDAGPEERD